MYNRKNTVDCIRALSERHGFERIDIGDLRCRENESYSGQIRQNAEGEPICVKDTWITHPGDAGMRAIADRILYALGM